MGNSQLQLKEMIAPAARGANVLAITSGKGGVGKSNIAANLSICLAAEGKKVLLWDADFSLGNLDLIMDLNSKYNIWHVIKGQKDIEDVIMEGPCGLDVICGSSGLEELANITEFHRHRLLDELTSLSKDHDAIIIDTAAGISKSVVGFCLASNHTLVVTTPDATAMADAYATIKVMAGNHYAGRISLIVNMAQSMAEGRKIYQQINKVAKRFLDIDIFNAGIIARDEKVTSALRSRKPAVLAYPRAKFTSSMTALASRISKGTAAQYGNEGFLKKVADWFF